MQISNDQYGEVDNIFKMRRDDYDILLPKIEKIVKAVENFDFTVKEVTLKHAGAIQRNELMHTIEDIVLIVISKYETDVKIRMQIPRLIDGNYIQITGRRKVPYFQLFDIPIITRKGKIKFRSNVITIEIDDRLNFSYMGKKIPFSVILLAYYGKERLDEIMNSFDSKEEPFDCLKQDIATHINLYPTYEQNDFIKQVGSNYTKYSPIKQGELINMSLDLIKDVDLFVGDFIGDQDILYALIECVAGKIYNDLDFTNKRIRCFEYVVLSTIAKHIFKFCQGNWTASKKRIKYKVAQTQILSEICNVSDIIQFDFSINPMEDLMRLTRASILGPGGFSKENVPVHLRDMNATMFGRICPIDTPDRENCGVLQNLIPQCENIMNPDWTIGGTSPISVSIPIQFVPFCEHDDQTRLQMASSQMRQSVMLKDFAEPMVQSGFESTYAKYTKFQHVAKYDGEVVYIDYKYIIVQYENNEVDVFETGFKMIYTKNIDYFNVYVKDSDKVKKGDVLADSNYINNGKISLGQNFLTGCMIYYGYNYEDGIVISESAQKKLKSVHGKTVIVNVSKNEVLLNLNNVNEPYKNLPAIGDIIYKSRPLAKIKRIPESPLEYKLIFEEPREITYEENVMISDVRVYANQYNETIPEYKESIEKNMINQYDREHKIQEIFYSILPKDEAIILIRQHGFNRMSKRLEKQKEFKLKNDIVSGMRIEIDVVYEKSINIGDKLANRHGNKGIISVIIPDDKMPRLADGRVMEICINPMGIISRMNIGQLFELHISMALETLRIKVRKMITENINHKVIKAYIKRFYQIIDNTKDKWLYLQIAKQIDDAELSENFIKRLVIFEPPFESTTYEMLKAALNFIESPFRQKMFIPTLGDYTQEPIAIGYMYFMKLVHMADEKLSARGVGVYAKKTLQPLAGRKNKGGQRLGEMEVASMIGHNAIVNLRESLTLKSDSIEMKNSFIKSMISNTDFDLDSISEEDMVPESIKLFNAYLKTVGVQITDHLNKN